MPHLMLSWQHALAAAAVLVLAATAIRAGRLARRSAAWAVWGGAASGPGRCAGKCPYDDDAIAARSPTSAYAPGRGRGPMDGAHARLRDLAGNTAAGQFTHVSP